MKRSEMIEIIQKSYNDQIDKPDIYGMTKKEAEIVMKAIEKAGMQPPTVIKHKDCYDKEKGLVGFDYNEWEQE